MGCSMLLLYFCFFTNVMKMNLCTHVMLSSVPACILSEFVTLSVNHILTVSVSYLSAAMEDFSS